MIAMQLLLKNSINAIFKKGMVSCKMDGRERF